LINAESIVIVGTGLAGGNAAVTLRNEGFPNRIVLIGNEPTVPYGRPPLSKTYLRGEEDLAGWYVKPAEWYSQNDVELRSQTSVRHVDVAQRQVALHGGEMLRYDRLILCSGGRVRRPRVTGVTLQGVHVLRTVADCEAIKQAARPGSRAVVVGMGFIGSEVAASLRLLGVGVTAVMGGAAPLEAVLGREVGEAMAGVHRDHDVELVPNDKVAGFEGADALTAVVTERGRRLECDFAVVGVGIEPDVTAIAGSDIAQDNGVLIDPRCRSSVPDVYAAGDVANHLHPLFGRIRVEHYNNAEKMGAAAARSALGDETPYSYVHSFWSDQYEDKLEYVGHAQRWDSFIVRGDLAAREFLGFYLEGGVLRAVVALNRGGDPELEPDSELAVCAKLIAQRASPLTTLLTDDNVPLDAFGAQSTVG
jgi:3-phenylpropionate/trans-cinnamate dioxygenase ferredoxin reductase component